MSLSQSSYTKLSWGTFVLVWTSKSWRALAKDFFASPFWSWTSCFTFAALTRVPLNMTVRSRIGMASFPDLGCLISLMPWSLHHFLFSVRVLGLFDDLQCVLTYSSISTSVDTLILSTGKLKRQTVRLLLLSHDAVTLIYVTVVPSYMVHMIQCQLFKVWQNLDLIPKVYKGMTVWLYDSMTSTCPQGLGWGSRAKATCKILNC